MSRSSNDSEETVLSPWLSPAVSDNPVADIVFNTPTNNTDDVVDVGLSILDLLLEDTASVFFKLLSGVNTTRNWSTSKDLCLHLSFTLDISVFGHLPSGKVADGSAGTRRSAGVALVLLGALLVLGLVVVASLIRDSDLVGVLVDGIIVTSLAVTSTSAINDVLD